ncbi:MAG: nucleotidyltransferase domain-containing protein [Methanobrevibacter sp.]|nr:nucleotidyltransferase domain-containing protein [Methanobrevibacter sp.]
MNNRKLIAHEFAEAINSKYIKLIILFGSVARGEDTSDSDIDILIISNYYEKIDSIITDLIGDIVLEKQELISAHIMSEERFNNTQHFSFLSNVLEEGEILVRN